MHGSRYNLLGCKKIVRHAYEYIACSNAQQRLMPPFRSDLQMPLSWIQIEECTSYEFESSKPSFFLRGSSKPSLCWIEHVFYFVASNLECIHVWDKCIRCLTLTTRSALINVYIWIAKAMHCLDFKSLSLYGLIIRNKPIHMLKFNRVWVSDRPMFVHTQITKFIISSKKLL